MQFAVISNNLVVNTIIADSKEIAEEVTGLLCIENDAVGIGYSYNEETGEFTAPVVEAPVVE